VGESILEFPEFKITKQKAMRKIIFEFKTDEAYQKYGSIILESLWFGEKAS